MFFRAFNRKLDRLMTVIADVDAKLTTFIADVVAYRTSVNDAVAKAVAAEQAGESDALGALVTKITAADDLLVASPFPVPATAVDPAAAAVIAFANDPAPATDPVAVQP